MAAGDHVHKFERSGIRAGDGREVYTCSCGTLATPVDDEGGPDTPATRIDAGDVLLGAYGAILDMTVPWSPGTADTPRRAAAAWRELTAGYKVDIAALFTTFDTEGYDEMIAVGPIPYASLCEHHLLPFVGHAHVVYLPSDRIVGLSKIPRVVDAFARRLQNQERLTANIADALTEHLAPNGLLVFCEAEHSCMMHRGVKSAGAMRTSVTRGAMRDKPATRAEALAMIGKG